MSWIDKINNIDFKIITGENSEFTPIWKNSEISTEYKTSVFDFIGLSGSFIGRKFPKARKIPLTFWFDGENNIDDAQAFEIAAADSRPWTVTHPFYGEIIGQPLSISRLDRDLNITEINVDFWETITIDVPDSSQSISDTTTQLQETVNQRAAVSYASTLDPQTADIVKNMVAIEVIQGNLEVLQDNVTNSEFQNAVNQAISSTNKLISDANTAVQDIQRIVDLPSTYKKLLTSKIAALANIYVGIKGVFETVSDKLFFESVGASVLASIANIAVNPEEGDYVLRSDVENTTTQLIELYNDYVVTLDQAQVQIYDTENTYMPNPDVQVSLSNTINYVVTNLFSFAFNAKQERVYYTKNETNLFLLTHRFSNGLDQLDEKLTSFREVNNIKLDSLFKIKKDVPVKYFV